MFQVMHHATVPEILGARVCPQLYQSPLSVPKVLRYRLRHEYVFVWLLQEIGAHFISWLQLAALLSKAIV